MTVKAYVYRILIFLYQKVFIPVKVSLLRQKRKIKVAFVLSDVSKWKSELLYKAMKAGDRFEPYILVTTFRAYEDKAFLMAQLIDYLNINGYEYSVIKEDQVITDIIKPDIIFYQQQYPHSIREELKYSKNLRSLFCFVPYAIDTLNVSFFYNQPLFDLTWQIYCINDLIINDISKYMLCKGRNCLATGLPIADILSLPPSADGAPFKKQEKQKIKIIWAPHFTMPNTRSHFYFSTFLRYSDYMLTIAEKYKDIIQIAFKPHPWLRSKLYDLWGVERTDRYYSTWANGENTQLATGDYTNLFKHSDAMIHDCGSFTVEYLYTNKPVMYLVSDEGHEDQLIELGKMAFNLHYKGRCEEDIDEFINNVIEGKDELSGDRMKFRDEYLLPSNKKTATENIINAILG